MNTHSVQRPTNQHKMPARRCAQDVSLTANTSDNSSPKMSQGLSRHPREKARTYPETCEPYKDDGRYGWLDDFKLPRAPHISTVALPELEDGEDFSYSGSETDLGGGLMGTWGGDPKATLLGCLDNILPELFAIDS